MIETLYNSDVFWITFYFNKDLRVKSRNDEQREIELITGICKIIVIVCRKWNRLMNGIAFKYVQNYFLFSYINNHRNKELWKFSHAIALYVLKTVYTYSTFILIPYRHIDSSKEKISQILVKLGQTATRARAIWRTLQ